MNRPLILAVALALPSVGLVPLALAKPPAKTPGPTIPWVDDLDSGLKAASKSRRPVFLVTLWGPGT